jgi:Lrp/AsnC family transcriptional regulator for asnA, asnC and gidA
VTQAKERPKEVLDATSLAIIDQLQQDGRRSYAAIGQAVGLSEAAVRQRVQRLTDTGVMQIVAVTDPMQVGFKRMALIGISVSGDLQRAAQTVELIGAVSYVVMTAGQYDLLAEVVCEDDTQLLEVLSAIRSIDDVTRTETFVYLKVRKQIYSWGTR